MELLQSVTDFINAENDCPVKIKRCELLYDSEKVRVFLRINIDDASESYRNIKLGIGCYGKGGDMLAVMRDIPYISGGMLVELPSLLTVSTAVAVESADLDADKKWESNVSFPEVFRRDETEDEFEKTEVIDSNEVNMRYEALNSGMSSKEEKKLARLKRYEEEEEIRDFIKNDPAEKKRRRMVRLTTAVVLIAVATTTLFAARYKNAADTACRKAMNLYNSGKFSEAVGEFESIEEYRYFGEKKNEMYWAAAIANAREYNFREAAEYFKKLNGYKESFANYRSILNAYTGIVSAGKSHTLALKSDGSVCAVGGNKEMQCNTSEWKDIIKISAGGEHSVGLVRDNTVVAVGNNKKRQCEVAEWENIIDISAGENHTVGVENVGSVKAVGDNTYGQCEVDGWSGIVSVSAGSRHTVGLKLDGTVVAIGDNSHGECNVSKWSNIVSVSAGNGFTAGLTGDGRIVFVGNDEYGISQAQKEKNVFGISAGGYNLLAVTDDGRVISFGSNDRNQGITDLWRNIVVAAGGEHHSVAVSNDGKLCAVGSNDSGQLSIDNISDIGIPKSTVTIRKGE